MKTLIVRAMVLLLAGTSVTAFTRLPGGEGFEVYVNGKVVLQRFGNDMNKPQVLRFTTGTENDEITVKYHHCGKNGTNRVLTIKDEGGRVLKLIRYADGDAAAAGMQCSVKDIISLRRGGNKVLKLYYSSSELPEGRLLVSIVADSNRT